MTQSNLQLLPTLLLLFVGGCRPFETLDPDSYDDPPLDEKNGRNQSEADVVLVPNTPFSDLKGAQSAYDAQRRPKRRSVKKKGDGAESDGTRPKAKAKTKVNKAKASADEDEDDEKAKEDRDFVGGGADYDSEEDPDLKRPLSSEKDHAEKKCNKSYDCREGMSCQDGQCKRDDADGDADATDPAEAAESIQSFKQLFSEQFSRSLKRLNLMRLSPVYLRARQMRNSMKKTLNAAIRKLDFGAFLTLDFAKVKQAIKKMTMNSLAVALGEKSNDGRFNSGRAQKRRRRLKPERRRYKNSVTELR